MLSHRLSKALQSQSDYFKFHSGSVKKFKYFYLSHYFSRYIQKAFLLHYFGEVSQQSRQIIIYRKVITTTCKSKKQKHKFEHKDTSDQMTQHLNSTLNTTATRGRFRVRLWVSAEPSHLLLQTGFWSSELGAAQLVLPAQKTKPTHSGTDLHKALFLRPHLVREKWKRNRVVYVTNR